MSILALCKFTPLGFETVAQKGRAADIGACKFTPLGFETTTTQALVLSQGQV